MDICLAEADNFLRGPKGAAFKQNLKRSATAGAIIGGIFGGASTGKASGFGKGVVGGAAAGAGSTLLNEAVKDKLTPDQLKSRYVVRCLNDKGFEVIGWM